MSDVSVDTSELTTLANELAAAAPKAERVSSTKLSEIAQQMRDDAVARAPEDTGDLKASIYLRGGKDYRMVGSELRYAFFVEFGTSDTAPQPYLWPAARTAEESLFRELEKLGDPFT